MNHSLRNSYNGMQGMPLLLHRRFSRVWVSHFRGPTRTLGKNAWAGSRKYLTWEVVRRGRPETAGGMFRLFFRRMEIGERPVSPRISPSWVSPLGRALMKSAAGDSVVLQLPGGTESLTVLEVCYEGIAVEPFREPAGSESSAEGLPRRR